MAKYLQRSEYVEVFKYTLDFQWENAGPHCGFGFDCDEEGNILWDEMNEAAEENLNLCLTGEMKGGYKDEPVGVFFAGISKMDLSYYSSDVIECEGCKNEVVLDDSWANPCDHCELEYNRSGQRLAPRSQWGGEFNTQPEEDIGLYEYDYSDGDRYA